MHSPAQCQRRSLGPGHQAGGELAAPAGRGRLRGPLGAGEGGLRGPEGPGTESQGGEGREGTQDQRGEREVGNCPCH